MVAASISVLVCLDCAEARSTYVATTFKDGLTNVQGVSECGTSGCNVIYDNKITYFSKDGVDYGPLFGYAIGNNAAPNFLEDGDTGMTNAKLNGPVAMYDHDLGRFIIEKDGHKISVVTEDYPIYEYTVVVGNGLQANTPIVDGTAVTSVSLDYPTAFTIGNGEFDIPIAYFSDFNLGGKYALFILFSISKKLVFSAQESTVLTTIFLMLLDWLL